MLKTVMEKNIPQRRRRVVGKEESVGVDHSYNLNEFGNIPFLESPTPREGGESQFLSLSHSPFPFTHSSFSSYCHHRCCGSIIKIRSTVSLADGRQPSFSPGSPSTNTASFFICSNFFLPWFIVRRKLDAICECTLKLQCSRIF